MGGSVAANAFYTSPEGLDFFGNPSAFRLTAASDTWSVGCLLFELLVGRPAFANNPEFALPGWHQRALALQRQHQWVS